MSNWWWNSSKQEADNHPAALEASSLPDNPPPTLKTPSVTSDLRQSIPHEPPPPPPHIRNQASISGSARLDEQSRDEESALNELRSAFIKSTSAGDSTSSSLPNASPSPEEPSYDAELYQTTLSCSACFDAAYFCSSVGGQLTNVYRYGALRSCSELWAQWRFCMRTKTMGEEERRKRIWEWNREKEARKKLGRNSDEVWGARQKDFTTAGEEAAS